MPIKQKEKIFVAPYEMLARIYDSVMSHVNYDKWADYIIEIVNRHNVQVQRILDISCGTGTLCLKLARKEYSVFGSDASLPMLKIARKKTLDLNKEIPFWRANMINFALNFEPDLIISLYDSMNYLLTEAEWGKCLSGVYHALREGGLFIFDVSTIHNSRYVFGDFSQRENLYDAVYFRKSRFDKRTMIQETLFEIRFKQQPNRVFCEKHQQRIRWLDEVEQLIKESPFKRIARYNGFSFDTGAENSERVHFVLQKSG